jgi:AraC family transcriptional regulator
MSHIPAQAGALATGGETLITLRAGSVRLRHQAALPFHLSYDGEQPLLLYVFQAPRSVAREGCKPGAFVLLRPGAPVELHHPEPKEVLAVAYDGEHRLATEGGWGVAKGGNDPGIRALAQEIRRTLRSEAASDPRYVEILAEGLLVRAARLATTPRLVSAAQPLTTSRLRRLIAFIDAHPDRPLPVAALAAVAGLSRAHFTRAFQAAVGQTPHRFVLSRRLEMVRLALEETDLDLSTLAARFGFSSHAHMSSAFRAAFGSTPSSYRRDLARRALPAA